MSVDLYMILLNNCMNIVRRLDIVVGNIITGNINSNYKLKLDKCRLVNRPGDYLKILG